MRAISQMLLDRRVIVIGALLFVAATTYGLLLGVFRNRIDDAYGAGTVGLVLSYFFAVRLVVSVAGGYFSDIIARRFVVATVFAVGGLALAIASIHGGVRAFVVAAVALGLVGGTVPVSATAFAADWFPAEKRTLGMGSAFFWNDAGTATALVAGQFLPSGGKDFSLPMLVFALLFVAAAVMSLLLPDMKGQFAQEIASNGK